MTTSSSVGIDVSEDTLDMAVPGEKQAWQVENRSTGIDELVQGMQELQPELIVVEATGGQQRNIVEALFHAGLCVAVVNTARVRQFARACGLLAKTDKLVPRSWQSLGAGSNPGAMRAKVKQRNS